VVESLFTFCQTSPLAFLLLWRLELRGLLQLGFHPTGLAV
jgi:hypothetical protein